MIDKSILDTCWRSWENFPCNGRYTVNLSGDQLTLTGEQETHYRFISAVAGLVVARLNAAPSRPPQVEFVPPALTKIGIYR